MWDCFGDAQKMKQVLRTAEIPFAGFSGVASPSAGLGVTENSGNNLK